MAEFALDPQLAIDTDAVAHWPLCEVRLMDDARYRWLILVPRVAGAVEVIDLTADQRTLLWQEVERAAHCLRQQLAPHKLNIAALGNVVSQLHVHVIARFHTDDAWPRPVWGALPRAPRDPALRAQAVTEWQRALQ